MAEVGGSGGEGGGVVAEIGGDGELVVVGERGCREKVDPGFGFVNGGLETHG